MRCTVIVLDNKTKKSRKCKNITNDSIFCRIHINTFIPIINNNFDSNTVYINKCCFCNEECNPCSQSCGRCARNLFWNMSEIKIKKE